VVAAFASPRSTVDAAVGRASAALELPCADGDCDREAELRDGDYFGTVLNRAAPVMAAGHRWFRSCGRLDGGSAQRSELEDLGRGRLRDLPNAIAYSRSGTRGLRTESPACEHGCEPWNLAATDDELHRARESELIESRRRASASPRHIDGMAGSSKTRLGLEIAVRLASGIPRRCLAFRVGRRLRSRSGARRGRRRCWASPSGQERASATRWPRAGGQSPTVRFRQLRARARCLADLVEGILAQSATLKVLATVAKDSVLQTSRCGRVVVAGRRRWPSTRRQ